MPKIDFTRKVIDFDMFTKIAYACGRFGQINCCQRPKKVAQSSINRPIWSYCLHYTMSHRISEINKFERRQG